MKTEIRVISLLVASIAAFAAPSPGPAFAQERAVAAGGGGYYVLDGFGAVHAGGGAPQMSPATPYFGFDAATDLELATAGYYVLDRYGGLHAGGGAPSIDPTPTYIGDDAGRDLELAPAHVGTLIFLDSEPGDFVGEGARDMITSPLSAFSADRNFDNGVSIAFSDFDPPTPIWWYLDFAAPMDATLTPGVYENATRFPFQASGEPGLSVVGNGNGCNKITGRFVVLEAIYDTAGEVLSFAADYEQHCEGKVPALFGSVRFNSTLSAPAYVLDGLGKLREAGGALLMRTPTPYFGFDIAWDVELSAVGYYVLDGFGGVHTGGGASTVSPGTPYFGFDVARDLELAPTGFYVLDAYGGVHAGGGAPSPSTPLPYFGFDIAQDLELASADEFYVLDGLGGVHTGGEAVLLGAPTPYFGFDVARDLELREKSPARPGHLRRVW